MGWVSRVLLTISILSVVGIHVAHSEPGARGALGADLSDEAEVTLITILPGADVYEAFGHSALRVHDPVQGTDRLYNYGTFQFDDWFIPKFLYGQLDYYLSVASFPRALRLYEQRERPVIEQRLDLSAEQRDTLVDFLRWNAEPENRVYRYDFLFDNCSTRIRDAFEDEWGAEFDASAAPEPGYTFREMLDLYVQDRPWTTFGFYLALGQEVDRDVTAREAMFLPDFLMEAADHTYIDDDDGRRSLVTETDTLLWIDGYTHPHDDPSFPWPTLMLWLVFAVGLVGTAAERQRGTRTPWMDRFDKGLLFVLGGAGLILAFLWFISLHEVTNQNLNLLWALPTHMLAAFLVGDKAVPRWLRHGYWGVTAVAALALLAGWPFWTQTLYTGLIPVLLLVVLRAAWRVSGPAPRTAE